LNHDGEISIEELKIALADENNKASLQELKNIMDSIDTDKNGKINYTEFLASNVEKDVIFSEEHLRNFFQMLDKDGNGVVERK
jgi:calcium-dependent protein kinase